MGCPFAHDSAQCAVDAVVQRCPFLQTVAREQGQDFARNIATRPSRPAAGAPAPVLEEGFGEIQATFELFHGSSGVVPLLRRTEQRAGLSSVRRSNEAQAAQLGGKAEEFVASKSLGQSGSLRQYSSQSAPLAAISLSFLNFLPGYHDFFGNKRPRRPKSRASGTDSPAQSQKPPLAAHAASGCPLRNLPLLGGLIPLTARGQLTCPPAIIALRAAVARLPPVKELRPQALPIRLVAIGLVAVLLNIPCGAVREHTAKFSPEWFLAVHITIPLIAPLRKAVLMPPWVIALTLASAILGQFAGSRMERQRIASNASQKHQRQQHTGQASAENVSVMAVGSSNVAGTCRDAVSSPSKQHVPLACGYLGLQPMVA